MSVDRRKDLEVMNNIFLLQPREWKYSVVFISSSPNEMIQFENMFDGETHSTQEYVK
jgi:hypothetical protein